MNPRKLLNLVSLRKKVKALQRQGKRIVFTNGCFDLLHVGHIRLLSRARALGDCLIVAVNTDTSVRKLKGPTRPIVPHRERVIVLAALSCIDYLILFGDSTPIELIKQLCPDVLVKGGDWVDIVGSHEVFAWGGEVVRIPLVKGRSTTRLIEKGLKPFLSGS